MESVGARGERDFSKGDTGLSSLPSLPLEFLIESTDSDEEDGSRSPVPLLSEPFRGSADPRDEFLDRSLDAPMPAAKAPPAAPAATAAWATIPFFLLEALSSARELSPDLMVVKEGFVRLPRLAFLTNPLWSSWSPARDSRPSSLIPGASSSDGVPSSSK